MWHPSASMRGAGAPTGGAGAPTGGAGAPMGGVGYHMGVGGPMGGSGCHMVVVGGPMRAVSDPMGGTGGPMGGASAPMGGASAPMGGACAPMGGACAPMGGACAPMGGVGAVMEGGGGGPMGGASYHMGVVGGPMRAVIYPMGGTGGPMGGAGGPPCFPASRVPAIAGGIATRPPPSLHALTVDRSLLYSIPPPPLFAQRMAHSPGTHPFGLQPPVPQPPGPHLSCQHPEPHPPGPYHTGLHLPGPQPSGSIRMYPRDGAELYGTSASTSEHHREAGTTANAVHFLSESVPQSSSAGGVSSADATGSSQAWLDQWCQTRDLVSRQENWKRNKKRMMYCQLSTCERLVDDDDVVCCDGGTVSAAVVRRTIRRRRRSNSARAAGRQLRRKRLQLLHRAADEWQRAAVRDTGRQTQADDVKSDADRLLKEVRRKIADINKQIQLVEGLGTLREVRDMKARQRGLYSSAESDQRFADSCGMLMEMLDKQLQLYETELQLLETMASSSDANDQQQCSNDTDWVWMALFGQRPPASVTKLRQKEVSQHWNMAQMMHWETDVQKLLAIRCSWDRHVVGDADPLGSSVPISWVVPGPASSRSWSRYQLPGPHN